MSEKNTVTALVPTTIMETQELAGRFAKSRLLPAELQGKEADVFVTILAGMELGLAPMAALRSIHIIKGKPVLSADGMVGVVQASGLCEYFTGIESSDKIATYETKRRGAPAPQRISFSIEEAKLAGLLSNDNWKRYPAAMLRARAKAALARDVYPDAIAGVYTEDELPAEQPRTQRQWSPAAAPTMPDEVQDAEIVSSILDDTFETRLRACKTVGELGALVGELKALPEGTHKSRMRGVYAEVRAALLGAQEQSGGAA